MLADKPCRETVQAMPAFHIRAQISQEILTTIAKTLLHTCTHGPNQGEERLISCCRPVTEHQLSQTETVSSPGYWSMYKTQGWDRRTKPAVSLQAHLLPLQEVCSYTWKIFVQGYSG